MITTIFVGILILVVSGLAFLAYYHYESYRNLAVKLITLIIVLLFACIAWNIIIHNIERDTNKIVQNTLSNTKDTDSDLIALKSELLDKLSTVFSSYELDVETVYYAYGISAAVLITLLFLPNIIEDHPYKKK